MSDAPSHLPLACGALGSYRHERVQALARALERSLPECGARLREVHADGRSSLWLDREPLRWGDERAGGLCWPESYPAPPRPPRDRQEAARLGALGLELAGERRVLFGSISGIGPLYWRACGEAAYFCTRLEPLIAVSDERLTPDAETWASVLTLGYHPGDGTPFEEIRRLGLACVLEHEPGAAPALRRERWPWVEVEPDDPELGEVAEAVLAALRARLAPLNGARPLRLPLSGGWDSRLLAILAAEGREPVETLTINPDKGNDKDVRFARAVAEGLGLPHRVLPTDPARFGHELRFAMEAEQLQIAPHLPMTRVALAMGSSPRPILDGLAGDMLLKAVYVTEPIARQRTWEDVVGGVWGYFVRNRAGRAVLGERWEALAAAGRAALAREAERFRGHPSAGTLVYYATRTRRLTSATAIELFGRVGPVSLPFLTDEVARAGLRVPLLRKLRGELYREVLRRTGSPVAALPSTNDSNHQRLAQRTPQLRSRPEAIATYEAMLRDHPAAELFGPQLRAALARGELTSLARGKRLRSLYGLLVLGEWLRRHDGRLRPLSLDGL